MSRPLKVGAVMYDPKVSVIWEIIRDFFDAQGAPIDVAFYSTYEDQNAGLLSGAIDIAWNSPLAWVDAQRRSGNGCRAIAMRDTDRDRISYVVARRDGPVRTLAARSIAGFTTMEEMFEQRAPLHRHIDAGDCGAAAAYLLSDDAKNVSGTMLYVDAGYHAMGM